MLKSIPELMQDIRPKLRCINVETAREEIAQNAGILIDVREPGETQEYPTNGAINIPRGVIEMKMSELFPDSTTPIYVHCATGARATLSGEQLTRIGYTNVSIITCDLETILKS